MDSPKYAGQEGQWTIGVVHCGSHGKELFTFLERASEKWMKKLAKELSTWAGVATVQENAGA